MKVEFWFDPVCPFCWMTSRWVQEVAPCRELEIEWRPISLLFKNNPPEDSPFYPKVSRTRDLLRVVESVRAAGHADRIGELYAAFGTRIHHHDDYDFDVSGILTDLGLDQRHADALSDDSFDAAIHEGMDDGLALTGNDVGTPIIAVTGRNGRVGLFGPVITEMPKGEDRLALWDHYVGIAQIPSFFELKRTRTASPDMSTIDIG